MRITNIYAVLYLQGKKVARVRINVFTAKAMKTYLKRFSQKLRRNAFGRHDYCYVYDNSTNEQIAIFLNGFMQNPTTKKKEKHGFDISASQLVIFHENGQREIFYSNVAQDNLLGQVRSAWELFNNHARNRLRTLQMVYINDLNEVRKNGTLPAYLFDEKGIVMKWKNGKRN